MANDTRKHPADAERRRGPWLRRILILLALLLVVAASGPFLVAKFGKGIIEGMASRPLNGRVTFESLSLGWFSPIEMHGLRVTADGAQEPQIAVDHARLDQGIFSVLKDRPTRAKLQVKGVAILARMEDGVLDLSRLAKPSDAPPGDLPDLDLELEIQDVRLRYKHEESPVVELPIDRIQGGFRTGQPVSIAIAGPGLDIQGNAHLMQGRRMREIDEVAADLAIVLTNWRLADLANAAPGAFREISGTLSGRQELRIDGGDGVAKGEVKLSNSRIALAEDSGIYTAERFELTNDLRLSLKDGPVGRIEVLAEGVQMPPRSPLRRSPLVDALLAADVGESQRVAWKIHHLRAEGIELKGSGRTDALAGMATTADVELAANLAQVAALLDGLPSLSGMLDSKTSIQWSQTTATSLKGRTSIRDLVAKNLPGGAPDVRDPEVVLEHDLTFGGGVVHATGTRLRSSFARAELEGDLVLGGEDKAPEGSLRFQGSAVLDRISDLLGDLLPVRMQGSIDAAGSVTGLADGLAVQAQLNGRRVVLLSDAMKDGPVTVGDLSLTGSGTVGAGGRSFRFPDLKISSPALAGSASVDMSLADAGPEGAISYDLQGQLTPLLGMVPGLPSLSGDLAAKGRLAMKGAAPMTIAGESRIGNLVARNLGPGVPDISDPLVAIDLDLDFGSGNLLARTARIRSSFLEASLAGALETGAGGLPSGKVDFQSRGDLSRLTALLGELSPVAATGWLTASGTLEGTSAGYRFAVSSGSESLVLRGERLGPAPFDMGRTSLEASGLVGKQMERIEIADGRLRSAAVNGSAKADLTRAGERWHGTIEGALDGAAGRLLALSPAPLPVRIEGATDIRGRVVLGAPIQFEGTVRGTHMILAGEAIGPAPWGLGALDVDAAGHYAPAHGQIQVARLKIASDPVQFEATRPIVVSGLGGTGEMKVVAHFKGAGDLGRIPPGLMKLPAGSSLAGGGQFEGAVTYEGGKARGSVNASVANLALRRPSGPSAFGGATLAAQAGDDGSFRIDLDGSSMQIAATSDGPRTPTPLRIAAAGRQDAERDAIEVQSLDIAGSGIRTGRGSGRYSPAGSRVVLNADLDLGELSRTWLSLFPAGIRGTGGGRLVVDLDLPGGGQEGLRRGSGTFSASADQITAGSLDLRSVQLEGTMADGLARIARGTARLNDGVVNVSGQGDFRQAVPLWQGGVQAQNVNLREELRPAVARVIPLFAGLGVNAGGVLKGDFNLNGSGKAAAPPAEATLLDFASVNGGGTLGFTSGFIEGGPILQALVEIAGIPPRLDLRGFDSNFQVRNGRVHQESLITTAQNLDLKLSGTTSVTGELDYTLGVRLTGSSNAKWQRYVGLVAKDGFLPLSIKGTVSNPGVPMPDPAKLIQGAAEGLINRGLGELFGPKRKPDPPPDK